MAIYDTMQQIRPDVVTICFGLAASMGAFLLTAGTAGKRMSPVPGLWFTNRLVVLRDRQLDIEIQAKEILYHKRKLNELLSSSYR